MVGTDSGIAFAAIEPMEIMNKVNQAILRSREFINFPVWYIRNRSTQR